MKRRVRKIANFFALYLNFIHKDKVAAATTIHQGVQHNTAAFSGTVLVDNPEKYLEKKNEASVNAQQPVEKAESNTGSKLSIN